MGAAIGRTLLPGHRGESKWALVLADGASVQAVHGPMKVKWASCLLVLHGANSDLAVEQCRGQREIVVEVGFPSERKCRCADRHC